RARLKHLTFRFKSAIEDYDNLIKNARDSYAKSESIYFKGQALWAERDYRDSIVELQKLLKLSPETDWKEAAMFYIGNSYEKLKDFNMAIFYYSKIAQNYTTPAPYKLMRLSIRGSVPAPLGAVQPLK
ncbi:MAG: tetratricopeptide repeat protein, partial [Candidatus Omnitrophica bacterium]|nr:tetratricopeptide repeat protein [Candidatus Omnitrophota bacterium]